MVNKYFTVEVKPTITPIAAGQHAAFADGDVLFDWTVFQIPRGGGRLIGAHVEVRPKGDSGATPNKFPLELLFARHNYDHPTEGYKYNGPYTLGALNSAPTNSGDINLLVDTFIGQVPIVAGDFADSIDPLAIASTSDTNGIVLQRQDLQRNRGNIGTGTAGTSRFYMAGIAGGALDFRSETLINNGDLDGPTMTTNGTDPRLQIAPGDTVAVCTTADTSVTKSMGVVSSLTATSVVLTEAFSTAVVDDDIVYNVNPIRILLTFER